LIAQIWNADCALTVQIDAEKITKLARRINRLKIAIFVALLDFKQTRPFLGL
jgi:hypothetical protein